MASAATMTVVVVSLYCEGQPPLLSPPFPPLSPSSSSSKQDDLDRKGLEILTGHADLSTTTTTTNLLVAATTSGHTALNDVNDNKVEPKLAVVFQPKVLSFSCDVRLEQMSSSGLGKKGRTCTMEKKIHSIGPTEKGEGKCDFAQPLLVYCAVVVSLSFLVGILCSIYYGCQIVVVAKVVRWRMKIPPHDRALVDLGNHHPWFCWSSVVHHFSTNRDAELCHRRCCNCSSATYYVSLNGEHNSLALIINSSRVAGKLYRVSPKVWTLSN